jgi:protein TonB
MKQPAIIFFAGICCALLQPGCASEAPKPGHYFEFLQNKVQENVQYPQEWRSSGEHGTATVKITILRDGTITAIEIQKSSGYPRLDAAAVDTIHRVGHFPPVPDGVDPKIESFSVVVPISYGESA